MTIDISLYLRNISEHRKKCFLTQYLLRDQIIDVSQFIIFYVAQMHYHIFAIYSLISLFMQKEKNMPAVKLIFKDTFIL